MDVDYSQQSVGSLLHARKHKISQKKRKYLSEKDREVVITQLSEIEAELCRRDYVTLHEDIAKELGLLHVEDLESPLVRETFEWSQDSELHKWLYSSNQ